MAPRRILDKPIVMSTQSSFIESRLQPLLFPTLNSDGSNFLEWVNNARIVLNAEDLANTLTTETATDLPSVCKWEVLLILRRHLDHSLHLQYLHIDHLAHL